ncbi:hypothetical protein PAXRUDRAFT_830538 [Paxillus rubicundulus Ve08.2h10]|uniref:Uncharacterized protein n=1 Tax=Paxillus rubicundulus Ve08.2h10 TaxID=930991 RepID=A0A0D0DYL2_9AGAM|nr:hypothetical protein PAXRUDRAFT_830538 [Paxillus rubicundulus Ve08.2h10]
MAAWAMSCPQLELTWSTTAATLRGCWSSEPNLKAVTVCRPSRAREIGPGIPGPGLAHSSLEGSITGNSGISIFQTSFFSPLVDPETIPLGLPSWLVSYLSRIPATC